MFFVVAVEGMCSERKSDRANSSSSEHQLDAQVAGDVLRNVRVVRDDAHVERGCSSRHLLPDAAETGESQRLLADLLAEKLLFLPFALLHRGIRRRDVPRQRQHEAYGEFRHADAVGAGSIHDDDAAGAGGGNVDIVDARAGARDGAQLGAPR